MRQQYHVTQDLALSSQAAWLLWLWDTEKRMFAEIGYLLGWTSLEEVADAAKHDTRTLVWSDVDTCAIRIPKCLAQQ